MNRLRSLLPLSSLILLGVIAAPSAQAQLAGDSVTGSLNFNGYGTTNYWDPINGFAPGGQQITQIVGPATWIKTGVAVNASLDATGSTLSILAGANNANGWDMIFTDNNPLRIITGVTPVSSYFSPGLTSSFTASTITIHWDGNGAGPNNGSDGNAEFAITTASTAVPEPGSVALFVSLGLSGAALLRRRRQ